MRLPIRLTIKETLDGWAACLECPYELKNELSVDDSGHVVELPIRDTRSDFSYLEFNRVVDMVNSFSIYTDIVCLSPEGDEYLNESRTLKKSKGLSLLDIKEVLLLDLTSKFRKDADSCEIKYRTEESLRYFRGY